MRLFRRQPPIVPCGKCGKSGSPEDFEQRVSEFQEQTSDGQLFGVQHEWACPECTASINAIHALRYTGSTDSAPREGLDYPDSPDAVMVIVNDLLLRVSPMSEKRLQSVTYWDGEPVSIATKGEQLDRLRSELAAESNRSDFVRFYVSREALQGAVRVFIKFDTPAFTDQWPMLGIRIWQSPTRLAIQKAGGNFI